MAKIQKVPPREKEKSQTRGKKQVQELQSVWDCESMNEWIFCFLYNHINFIFSLCCAVWFISQKITHPKFGSTFKNFIIDFFCEDLHRESLPLFRLYIFVLINYRCYRASDAVCGANRKFLPASWQCSKKITKFSSLRLSKLKNHDIDFCTDSQFCGIFRNPFHLACHFACWYLV